MGGEERLQLLLEVHVSSTGLPEEGCSLLGPSLQRLLKEVGDPAPESTGHGVLELLGL